MFTQCNFDGALFPFFLDYEESDGYIAIPIE